MVPVTLGAVLGGPRLLEPVVLVRSVVNDQVEDAVGRSKGQYDASVSRRRGHCDSVESDVMLCIYVESKNRTYIFKPRSWQPSMRRSTSATVP